MAIINSLVVDTLTFTGSVVGQAALQAQPIGGNLTFLLPNTAPAVGQLLVVQSISGNGNVFLGWAAAQEEIIPVTTYYQTIAGEGTHAAQEPVLNFAAPAVVTDNTGVNTTITYPNFVGDSGSGGTAGLVLAPPAGSAAAGDFLSASGSWATPSTSLIVGSLSVPSQTGSLGPTNIFSATSAPLYFLAYYLNCTILGTAGNVTVTITFNDGVVESVPSATIPLTQLGGTGGTLIVTTLSGNPQYTTVVQGASGGPEYDLEFRWINLG